MSTRFFQHHMAASPQAANNIVSRPPLSRSSHGRSFFLALFGVLLLPFLALPAQAQITNVNNYTDLQTNAALATGGATIRLTANIIDGVTQLTIGRSLTLDLNGHSLTIDLPPATGAISNGIKINNGVTLTIMDSSLPSTGTLTVTNGADDVNLPANNSNFGAAINASEGELIIESGTIEVTGGRGGAGIGGGRGSASGTITINGGTVNVTGGSSGGASIGGGQTGNGSTITINGGTVTAIGGIGGGAGIGGGGISYPPNAGKGGTITITGGTVTAIGGGGKNAAGIGGGGGGGGDGGTIMISGGTVRADGGNCAAAIGGGGGGSNSGDITITGDASVTAKGGECSLGDGGAGIGSGGGPVLSIVIDTTGTVTATGGGNPGGAPIGNGGFISSGGSAGIYNVTHPTDQTAIVGQTAAFASMIATAGGLPAPLYQWQVSAGGGAFANVMDGVGGATANYTTVATILAMSGNLYRNVMTASNINGNGTGTIIYTSHPAKLTVNALASPTLTLSASPAGSVTLPSSVTLMATLTGAAPSVGGHSIEFFVDGVSVGTGTTNASGVATFTFTPPNAGTYDFGAEFAADANNNAATATGINGYVVRQGSGATASIPVLNPAMLMLLALTLGGMAFQQRRRKV